MTDTELARRVRRIEDIAAIKRVKSDYALAADDRQGCSVNVDRMMPLFADDAVWDGRPRYGRYEGCEAIREMFVRAPARIEWSLHFMLDCRIDIAADRRSARGLWYLLEMARMRDDRTGGTDMVWLGGTYDDEFRRVDGAWKFQVVRFDCQVVVDPMGELKHAANRAGTAD